MSTLRGLVILAACLSATIAVPAQDRATQSVMEGVNQFSSALYKEISGSKPDNLVTSPLSASLALSMAAYGSRGETENEFKRVLHLPEESVARTGYANFIDSLNAAKNVELHLANKIFINNNFSVKPTFHELTQTAFRSASEKVNFADTHAAANTINQWVEQQTKDRIKDIIKPDTISGDTSMVLVNALYFKANWQKKFKLYETRDRSFHVTKSQVKNVPTMHMLESLRYGVLPELKARFIELPFEGGEMSMIIVLPDENDGLAQVEQKLAQQDLTQLVKTGHSALISLSLPKFKIESTLDLNEHLENMGLKKAFDRGSADFSGISDTGVYISSVIQKTFIEVHEKGTEAAAATGIVLVPLSATIILKQPVNFEVDRPFFYSIIRNEDGSNGRTVTPLFEGHVTEPKL